MRNGRLRKRSGSGSGSKGHEPCALNSRKKADLQDIAYALGLNIEGMVEDLKSRINAYFDEHEPLRTAPRYIGLFPQLERQGNHRPKFLIAV